MRYDAEVLMNLVLEYLFTVYMLGIGTMGRNTTLRRGDI